MTSAEHAVDMMTSAEHEVYIMTSARDIGEILVLGVGKNDVRNTKIVTCRWYHDVGDTTLAEDFVKMTLELNIGNISLVP